LKAVKLLGNLFDLSFHRCSLAFALFVNAFQILLLDSFSLFLKPCVLLWREMASIVVTCGSLCFFLLCLFEDSFWTFSLTGAPFRFPDLTASFSPPSDHPIYMNFLIESGCLSVPFLASAFFSLFST